MNQTLEQATERNDYIPISASMLSPSRLCEVALYVCDGEDDHYRLFRTPNIPITPEWMLKLEETGRRKLYIPRSASRPGVFFDFPALRMARISLGWTEPCCCLT